MAAWKFLPDFSEWLPTGKELWESISDDGTDASNSDHLQRLKPHLRDRVSTFLDVKTAVSFARTCRSNSAMLESPAFDAVCKRFYTKHWCWCASDAGAGTVAVVDVNWAQELKLQLTMTQRIRFAYQKADYQAVEKCLSGDIEGNLTQQFLLKALYYMAKQKPVQSTSRRAFIFTIITKRVSLFNLSKPGRDGETLLSLATSRKNRHYIRLLTSRGAKGGTTSSHKGIVRRKRQNTAGLNKENRKNLLNGFVLGAPDHAVPKSKPVLVPGEKKNRPLTADTYSLQDKLNRMIASTSSQLI